MTLGTLYAIATVAIAAWTYFDARRLDDEGLDSWMSPLAAGFVVLLIMPICFPAYLANRSAALRDMTEPEESGPPNRPS